MRPSDRAPRAGAHVAGAVSSFTLLRRLRAIFSELLGEIAPALSPAVLVPAGEARQAGDLVAAGEVACRQRAVLLEVPAQDLLPAADVGEADLVAKVACLLADDRVELGLREVAGDQAAKAKRRSAAGHADVDDCMCFVGQLIHALAARELVHLGRVERGPRHADLPGFARVHCLSLRLQNALLRRCRFRLPPAARCHEPGPAPSPAAGSRTAPRRYGGCAAHGTSAPEAGRG